MQIYLDPVKMKFEVKVIGKSSRIFGCLLQNSVLVVTATSNESFLGKTTVGQTCVQIWL